MYNVVAVLTMTITVSIDIKQRNVMDVFQNFREYVAYM
jgi:hypothetical protein